MLLEIGWNLKNIFILEPIENLEITVLELL